MPLSGASAALGLSMQRAAALAQPIDGRDAQLFVFDTGGTAEGAQAAARQAIRRGAKLILGPLFAAEVRPVLAAAGGRVPVLSFSNDDSLHDSGAFLLGLTPSQMTGAILQYARKRGVRTVAMPAGEGNWARAAAEMATRLQGEIGISLITVAGTDAAALSQANGGELPDALFLPDGGAGFIAAARALKGSGVQMLGTMQALDHAPASLAAIEGAWLAAPDPAAFAQFARDHQARNGGAPGAIAALAYDAANIAKSLATAGQVDRAGLLAGAGFPGVTGAVRFRADGTCVRELSILVAGAEGYSAVDRSASA
ncbi:ABC transporter substrate-binding protein [Sphingomonas oleivorans]|uniref:ABC transporter substrate-binding protein n=1 Tax=Sphingomonas oleivorans TaxID=1735121 RepID=UPI001FAF7479|nr:penicillin-binding protein activator [Sphingomonas oleivorans]